MARSTLPATATEVPTGTVTGGVDTHLDVHVVAALDPIGGLLGTASFPTTPVGYRELLEWLQGFGTISVVGVEGTSSYGVGLTRTLQAAGVSVLEVDRPNRQVRRRQDKSDALDAIAAARSGGLLKGAFSQVSRYGAGTCETDVARMRKLVRSV